MARLGLCAVVAPILLHNSVYLADLNGPDSAEWSRVESFLIMCGLAATLAFIWAATSALQSRATIREVLWLLALDALAAAIVVMLSGYYRGGLLGLGLASAITGATLASYFLRPQLAGAASLGMSVVGIFAVVIIGRFFGSLSTGPAACLLLAPLLAWTVELPRLRDLGSVARGTARLVCVAVPLVVVVLVAQHNFIAAAAARSRVSAPASPAQHP